MEIFNLQEVTKPILLALSKLQSQFFNLFPNLLTALLILVVGYILGRVTYSLVNIFLRKVLGLDRWIREKGLSKEIFGISVSSLVGGIAKWYVYFIFINVAITYLQIPFLSQFLTQLIEFFPRIIVAILVGLGGAIAGGYLKHSLLQTELPLKEELGSLAKFFTILIFLVIALQSVFIKVEIIFWLIIILLASLFLPFSLALGIGLGLALKDEFKPLVRKVIRKLEMRR